MKGDKRQAPSAQPTEERTADPSTPSASGLSAGRPGDDREQQRAQDQEDVAARTGRGEDTPRRYDTDVDDDAKPSGDPSLKPKF